MCFEEREKSIINTFLYDAKKSILKCSGSTPIHLGNYDVTQITCVLQNAQLFFERNLFQNALEAHLPWMSPKLSVSSNFIEERYEVWTSFRNLILRDFPRGTCRTPSILEIMTFFKSGFFSKTLMTHV